MFSSLTRDKWQISQRILQRKRGPSECKKLLRKRTEKKVTIQIEVNTERIIDFLLDRQQLIRAER